MSAARLRRIGQTVHTAGFVVQVAHHEHTDQRRYRGNNKLMTIQEITGTPPVQNGSRTQLLHDDLLFLSVVKSFMKGGWIKGTRTCSCKQPRR
jgi:hypothetical protein